MNEQSRENLSEKKREEFRKKQNEKLDSDYFYIENEKMVFTEKYLLERGYCCESGCRHCPYGFEKNKLVDR